MTLHLQLQNFEQQSNTLYLKEDDALPITYLVCIGPFL